MSEAIGRSEILTLLTDLMQVEHIVALVGPPGIGKSTVARALQPSVRVDLESCTTLSEARSTFAAALGCPADNDEAVTFALRDCATVLLDGVDGIDDVEELCALGPSTAWLLTSVRQLPGAGSVVELGPLEPEHGAAVIRAHVRSARRRNELVESELQALSKALDGIPMLLALVGPRLRVRTPAQLLESGLEQRSWPERQRFERNVEVMVGALDEPAREALVVASVLPGSFTASRLSDALGRPADDALLALLDAALVHPLGGDPPRFKVLAPIRNAASGGPREEVLRRVAGPSLARAEEGARAATADGLAMLQDELPLLRVLAVEGDPSGRCRASRWLAYAAQVMGNQDELANLAVPDDGPPELRLPLVWAKAKALRIQRSPAVAMELLEQADPLVDDTTRAEHLLLKAVMVGMRDSIEVGRRLAEEALVHGTPRSWRLLGALRFDGGQNDEAVETLRRGTEEGLPHSRARARISLATSLMGFRPHDPEIPILLDGVDLGAFPGLAHLVLDARAFHTGHSGDLRGARELFGQAEHAAMRVGVEKVALWNWMMCHATSLALEQPPLDLLKSPPYFVSRAKAGTLDAWRAVTHAVLGHAETAAKLGPPTIDDISTYNARWSVVMASMLAAALEPTHPDLSAALMDGLPDEPLTRRAHAILSGADRLPPTTFDGHLLEGIARQVQRVTVTADGSAFTAPDGRRVDISRRRVLARILATLANAEGPLDVDAICAVVWPDETMVGNSGTRRVHVAMSTLRGLGLRDAIETLDGPEGTCWRLNARVD